MFTGLVEARGIIQASERKRDVVRLCIAAPGFAEELVFGQSVAVAGACLTVTRLEGSRFWVDMMPETRETTILGFLSKGSAVNLERAMVAGNRFEGHIVAGHVDYVGTVAKILRSGDTRKITVSLDSEGMRYLVPKGSVTLNGVSLTVIECGEDFFSVGLIPTTLEHTTIGELREGVKVNVETDLLGKYVYHQLGLYGKTSRWEDMSSSESPRNSLDWDTLRKAGWI
ncbi:MAG TPA: riboflavin synthase [Synergistaceae bacterium]|nr:riboflavin synthase [Synergistaceae bacterium]HPJ25918.1 riboflavin synthase [Synergistaceae bacterium]HPQ36080.1 riboflavin synthase [Synergistaceae bacterium]